MKRTLIKNVMPLAFVLIIMGMTEQTIAQKADVEKRLIELEIESDFNFKNLSENSSDYSCNATMTETTTDKTTVNKASFDPQKPEGSRWSLISTNGASPTKKDIKQFNKAHNIKQDNQEAKPDDNSWKIVNEDEHMLVIGLNYNEADLPHKYKYLAQCNAEIYIDKEAKRLYKVKFYNTAPLKVKIFNVPKLDLTIELMPSKDGKSMLIKDETIIMDAKILGQLVEITEENEFYDYKKVK